MLWDYHEDTEISGGRNVAKERYKQDTSLKSRKQICKGTENIKN